LVGTQLVCLRGNALCLCCGFLVLVGGALAAICEICSTTSDGQSDQGDGDSRSFEPLPVSEFVISDLPP